MEISELPHFDSLHVPPIRTQHLLSNLRVGQVITARVREKFADGSYLIELKGRLVQADSARSFVEGEEVELVVRSLRPHVLLQAAASKADTGDLQAAEGVLSSLGLPVSEANQQAVVALLKFGIQPSAENVTAVALIAEEAATQAEADAAAFLLTKGIAPTPDLARSVAELMLGGDMLAELLTAADELALSLIDPLRAGESFLTDIPGLLSEISTMLSQNPHLFILDPSLREYLANYALTLKELAARFSSQIPDPNEIAPAAQSLAELLSDIQSLAARLRGDLPNLALPESLSELPEKPVQLLRAVGLAATPKMQATLRQLASEVGEHPNAAQLAALLLAGSRGQPPPTSVEQAARFLSAFPQAQDILTGLEPAARQTASLFAQLRQQLQAAQAEMSSTFIEPAGTESLQDAATTMATEPLIRALEGIAEATRLLLQANPQLRNLATAIELLLAGYTSRRKATTSAEKIEPQIVEILPIADQTEFSTKLRKLLDRLSPKQHQQLLGSLQAREESRIRDMPLLQQMRQLFHSTRTLAARMASYKVLDLSGARHEPQILYAEIPITNRGNSATARLRFYIRRRTEGEARAPQEPYTVVIDLTTSNLGRIFGNLALREDLIRTRLVVADDSVRTMFIVHQRELEERLKEEGFRLTFDVVCRRREEEPPPFLDIPAASAPATSSGLDIRV